jgi:hypothetical protein
MLKILENFYHLINPNTEYDINADANAWGIYAKFVDIDGNEFLFTGMKSTGSLL